MVTVTHYLAVVLLALSFAVQAQDPALERRVTHLAHELRCLVCQNQTIADSNAPLAVDLRNQIREQIAAGKSDQDIIDFMVQRYGDFVLYRPPVKLTTLALWAGPFLFLILGLFFLVRFLRSRRVPEPSLTEAERARAAKLLE
jgi:cytochrome c-type biogenesis protein CcmH